MEDLQRELEELKRTERMVQEQIEGAKQVGQEIDESVNQWLKEAHKIGNDVMKFNWAIDKKAKSSRMKRLFSSNREAKKSEVDGINMINKVNTIAVEGKSILSVYFNTDTKGIELVWRDDFVEFESRKLVFKRIMDSLMEEEGGIIGVFGMGGIGKTKLAVEIAKKAQDEKLFSKVAMATVSQKPNIRNIQGMIADMAGLKLNQDTDEIGRSNELRTQLGKQEKILVILDDAWEKIDTERIGIPKGCKIVLTTRREEVCQNMGCVSSMCLDRITYREALSLFKSYSSTDRRPDLEEWVKKIVKECGGLPLALATVGSALRDKGEEEFGNAAWRLSNSRFVEIEAVDRDIYACLRLSYDYLNDIETQKCLLLCSLLPEDTIIQVEDLASYAYGLCLFRNVESVDQARQKMIASVIKLKDACLLSPIKDNVVTRTAELVYLCPLYFSYVKMHDMIRDVAIWIAKSDGLFLVPASLKECQRKDKYEKTSAIHLNSQDLLDDNCPQYLDFPNLKILIFHIGPALLPGKFFKKACSLQVLDFEMETTWDTVDHLYHLQISMPVSLQYLVNLKVLHVLFSTGLRNLDRDMSIISKLKSLEILDLSLHKDEKVLPEWIGELCNLRVLDLSTCGFLELIPCDLLPKLAKLEELYTSTYPNSHKWSYTFLPDLRFLPHLSVFSGCFMRVKPFPDLFERWQDHHRRARILRLDEFNDESMKNFERLWPGVVCLEIGMNLMQDINNLCPQLDKTGFQNIRFLQLRDSKSLEYLIDTTTERGHKTVCSLLTTTILPNLVDLWLSGMKQLCRICNGPPPHQNFLRNLVSLRIMDCPRIEKLLPDMFPVAPHLKLLVILSCGALKSLYDQVQTTRTHQLSFLSCELDKQKLINVGCGDAELQTMNLDAMLTSLTEVEIHECSNLEELFPVSEINNQHPSKKFTNLDTLSLRNLPKLKSIWKVPQQQSYYLLNLREVHLFRCDKLSSVFTSTLTQTLVKLERLYITECALLETIISAAGYKQDDEPSMKMPHYSSTSWASFQELRELTLNSCPKLKTVLPKVVCLLPKLEDIIIRNCGELERIFGDGEDNKADSLSQDVVLKSLDCLTLVDLPKLALFSAFTWNQMLTSLRTLRILSGTMFKQDSDIVLTQLQVEKSDGMLPIRAAESLYRMELDFEGLFTGAEEVFNVEDAQQPILTQLQYLKLGNMTEVQYLWRGPAEFIDLCNLKQIEVHDFPAIKCLFPHSFCLRLRSLESFKVYNCKQLKNIFEPCSDLEEHFLHGPCFPVLNSLHVSNCEILESIFPVCVAPDFPSLESYEVRGCPKIEENIYTSACHQEHLCLA